MKKFKKLELVKELLKRDNIDNHNQFYTEHKFGLITTKCIKKALKTTRKELKTNYKITSGHLAYSVKLMVKMEAGAKYHIY